MLRVMIVDDEPVAVRRMGTLLRAIDDVTVVAVAGNATEALDRAAETLPSLVFLDIEMPGQNGIELAGRLRSNADPPAIVFVTAFGRFALDAFDLAAADYLLKPVEPTRLAEAICRVRGQVEERAKAARSDELEQLVERLRSHERHAEVDAAIWLPVLRSIARIRIADILWMGAERDYVRVYDSQRSYLVRGRIGEFAKRFASNGMVRIHRSALVRIEAVTRIEYIGDRSYRLWFANGASVLASRRFAAAAGLSLRRPDAPGCTI